MGLPTWLAAGMARSIVEVEREQKGDAVCCAVKQAKLQRVWSLRKSAGQRKLSCGWAGVRMERRRWAAPATRVHEWKTSEEKQMFQRGCSMPLHQHAATHRISGGASLMQHWMRGGQRQGPLMRLWTRRSPHIRSLAPVLTPLLSHPISALGRLQAPRTQGCQGGAEVGCQVDGHQGCPSRPKGQPGRLATRCQGRSPPSAFPSRE